MTFFVRRYQKGIKNSGTQDILTSDEEISLTDFVGLAHQTGPGKYLLGERGRGIRGFRKITDCIVEPTQVFAAETVQVRKTLKLQDMNDSELMELLGSMSRTTLNSPEELTTFQEDLNNIHRELARRNGGSTVPGILLTRGAVHTKRDITSIITKIYLNCGVPFFPRNLDGENFKSIRSI